MDGKRTGRSAEQDTSSNTKPHLGWVCTIAGVGLAVLAWPLATAGGAVASVWQSVGVNIGTALVLAALLVFVEPHFRTRIVQQAAKSAEEKYETRVAALTERVDNLQESTRELFERYGAKEDDAVTDMVSHPSFYSVATALAEANKGHAIDRVLGVTVPAASGIPQVLIQFRYVSPTRGREGDHSHDFLGVTPTVLTKAPNGHFWPGEGQWDPAEAADQIGARLMKELQVAGLKSVEAELEWEGTIDRLGRSLKLAFESKRSDGKLAGHIIEMGPGEWFLTSAGIEHLKHGVVVDVAEFPPPLEKFLAVAGAVASGMELPELEAAAKRLDKSPSWADPDEWKYILARARAVFPGVNKRDAHVPPAIASMVAPVPPEPKRPAPPVIR